MPKIRVTIVYEYDPEIMPAEWYRDRRMTISDQLAEDHAAVDADRSAFCATIEGRGKVRPSINVCMVPASQSNR